MDRRRGTILVNAATAHVGGGLAFATELVPRLRATLAGHGYTLEGPRAGGFLSAQLDGLTARRRAAVFNVANTSLLGARSPQLVAVRDRILVDSTNELAESHSPRTVARRAALDLALRQCAVCTIPTEAMRAPLVRFAGRRRIRVPPVEVVGHGAPVGWEPAPMPPFPPLRILNPSYGASQKNIPLLIRAVGRLPADLLPSLTLTVPASIGGGALAADAERWAPGRVQFVGGVPRAELASLYADHHVLAFPSRIESLGIPLLEALAAGRPVVVSDLDWAREVCGPFASYAPVNDVDAWGEAIEGVTGSAGFAQPADVPAAWLARYSWDSAGSRYAALLASIAG